MYLMVLQFGNMVWIQLGSSYHLGSAGLICQDSFVCFCCQGKDGFVRCDGLTWRGWEDRVLSPRSFILSKLARAWSQGSYCLPNSEGRCMKSLSRQAPRTCTALPLPLLLARASHKARPYSRRTERDFLFMRGVTL